MISVIICTYNRCESLQKTLESLYAQEGCEVLSYEIIVVDNNSKDQTKAMVESFEDRLSGKLRYAFETNQGLSFARNRGISESKGEVIAFTDDDVIVDGKWISQIVETIAHYNADCVFGKILPHWQAPIIPNWLANNNELWPILALLDYGDDVKIIESEQYEFYGANFAIKREVFDSLGLFNTSLGRSGANLISGEDTEIFKKMLFSKRRIIYNPCVCVRHVIDDRRIKKSYFRKWYYWAGRKYAQSISAEKKNVFGIPQWFIKKSIKNIFKLLKHSVCINEKKAFKHKLIFSYNLGVCIECVIEWVGRKKTVAISKVK